MTRTETFTIPASSLYRFEQNIRRLNKKAVTQRAGSKFTSKVSEPRKSSYQVEDSLGNVRKVAYLVVDVEVTGPSFSLGNFSLITMADFVDPEAPIFSDFTNDDFDGYKSITRSCHHCNTDRPRRKMFVLKNNESGEYVQVGKSCLKDYTGHSVLDSVKGCALWFDLRDHENDEMKSFTRSPDLGEQNEEIIGLAIRSINERGYVNKAEAEEKWIMSTADHVRKMAGTQRATDEEKAQATKIIEWAMNEYADETNSFALNVTTILENGFVNTNRYGFVACLPAMKLRADERAAANALNATSEYFGKVKERMTIEAEVIGVNYIESFYGMTSLYTLRVGKNIAKWFASNNILEVGETYTLKATVKDHDEFRGTKQTILTRCAIVN